MKTITNAPTYVREICARWQSSGTIGSAFAAVASDRPAHVDDFLADIIATQRINCATSDVYGDMERLTIFACRIRARYSVHIVSHNHGNMYYACASIKECVAIYRANAINYARYGVTLGSGTISKHDEHDNETMSCNDPFIILSVGPRGGIRVERV